MTGFKNPPKHSQFKPGKSGNPKGRPKKNKDMELINLAGRLMSQITVVTREGKKKKTSITEALILKTIQDAFAGNARARELLLKLYAQYKPPMDWTIPDAESMTMEEAQRRYLEMVRRS